jgi:hypothetical protein
MKFVFKKPPRGTIYCYSIGFSLIALTMLHQFLAWQWLTPLRNQQLFIVGALTVTLGSLLNWVLPLLGKYRDHPNE